MEDISLIRNLSYMAKVKVEKSQQTRDCLFKDRQLLCSVGQLEMKYERYPKFLTDPGLALSIKFFV